MRDLYLMRLRMDQPALMRFAQEQDLMKRADDGFGYLIHAWLAATFDKEAPKPFRHLEASGELLGFTRVPTPELIQCAQSFASPIAWAALEKDSLATKPMPTQWRPGRRLQVEVLACPVTRKDGHEKDIYLRSLDRLGEQAPSRGDVYLEWFRRQWYGAVHIEHAELAGVGRRKLLRRSHAAGGGRRLCEIERPEALFRAVVQVADGHAFGKLLARGIGRHRAFGFGMPLISPVP